MSRHFGAPWRGLVARASPLGALVGLLLTNIAAVAAPADVTLDSVLASLAQRRHGHALYSEQIDSPLFTHPLQTSGELFFDAPDRLEKKTLRPAPQDLVVEGDTLTIERGTHRRSVQLSDYPQLSPLLNGLRATLAGDRSTLEKSFQLTLNASGLGWTLTLQPLAADTKPVYKRIEIHGVEAIVQGVMLERVTGERTTMSLSQPAES